MNLKEKLAKQKDEKRKRLAEKQVGYCPGENKYKPLKRFFSFQIEDVKIPFYSCLDCGVIFFSPVHAEQWVEETQSESRLILTKSSGSILLPGK